MITYRKAKKTRATENRSKIVIVGEYVHAHENSTGYFWESAISHLRAHGMNVDVVSYTRPMSTRVRANAVLRLATKTVVALGLTLGVFKASRRGDVVFSGTNPEILLPILVIVCRLRGARLCVLVHDVFPENLVAAGLLSRGGPAMRALSAIYSRVYASFDKAIVIGRDMRDLVDQKAGKQIAFSVHNWVASDDVHVADRLSSGILEKLGWEDRVVFQFFGNMGRLQDIDTLLKAMDLVTTDKAAFLFAGSGVMRPAVEEACKERVNRHVMALDHSYSRSAMLSSCDIALVCLDQRMLGLGVPSKAYFSLAADRPILAIMDENAEVAKLVTEERVGWHVRAGDPIALAAAIDRICTEEPLIGSGLCRALSKSRLSADLALEKVLRQLEGLME